MNRKVNIFYITTVAVAVICLILDLIFQDLSFSFLGICFAITMLVYGFCLIFRGFRFKIDSSLFLGIIIFVFGIISVMIYFTPWSYFDLYIYMFLGASLASIVTGLYFKVSGQKKLSILFLVAFVIALLHQIDLYNVWIMLLLWIVAVICFIIVNNILRSRRK